MKARTTSLSTDNPAQSRELREISRLINLMSSGKLAGTVNAYTAAPTTGTWAQGDVVRNSAPEYVLTGPDEGFIIKGWTCVESGTPGVWVEERQAVASVPVPPAPSPTPTPSPPAPPPSSASNLLLWSEQFQQSAWAVGMTPVVSTNVSNDPNGAATVDQLTTNLGTSQWVRQAVADLTIGETYTFSVYVQQGSSGSATNIRLTTNNTEAWNTGASTEAALTGSLVRHSVTWTQTGTTTAALMIGVVAADGVGEADCVGNVRLWGAMLNTGTSAATYVKTEGSAVSAPAPSPSSQKIQAEAGTITGTPTLKTDIAGYQGTGHLDWFTVAGDAVEVNFTGVTAGAHDLNIRYANYGAQQEDLIINGGAAQTIALPGTSGVWSTKTVPVTLTSGANSVKLLMNYGYSFYDSLEITTGTAAPPPAPSGTLPAQILGCYYETYVGPSPSIVDLSQDINLIFIFHAKPDGTPVAGTYNYNNAGNGAFRFMDGANVTQAQVQTCRLRGQKVILTVGGWQAGYAFDTRAKSQNFVASFQTMYDEFGGLDGCDFNNFEGGITPSTVEMAWICGRLKEIYGNDFAITTPPGATSATQRAWISQLVADGLIDLVGPQYYDWNGYGQVDVLANQHDAWVAAIGASKTLVGFSANYANGPSLSDCVREWNTIKGRHPTIRGMFCWTGQTNLAGGNLWSSTMKALQ